MTTFTNTTGLQILEFISRQKMNYGRNNLSKMICHEWKEVSIQQVKDLFSQLIELSYLREMEVGMGFSMIVLSLTEKGQEAIKNKEEINLDFQRFYSATFKPATDIGIIDKAILEEYFHIKQELIKLQKREEELKATIKSAMVEKQANELHNEFMDIYCKKTERVTYPKEKIEKYVPEDILSKIRTVNENIILITKLK